MLSKIFQNNCATTKFAVRTGAAATTDHGVAGYAGCVGAAAAVLHDYISIDGKTHIAYIMFKQMRGNRGFRCSHFFLNYAQQLLSAGGYNNLQKVYIYLYCPLKHKKIPSKVGYVLNLAKLKNFVPLLPWLPKCPKTAHSFLKFDYQLSVGCSVKSYSRTICQSSDAYF